MAFETTRHTQILQLLQNRDFVTIRELRDKLCFSEATVRRDLEKMEKSGLLIRVRGGAISNHAKNAETPLMVRRSRESAIKKQIAAYAATMVEHGDVLILDSSTTVMHMLPFLASKKGLTIITDGLVTAMQVADQLTCNLICLGGAYNPSTASFLGRITRGSIRNNFAAKIFFSVNSVDLFYGLTDQGEELAEVKSAMIRQAEVSYLLADSGKFGRHSFATVCPIDAPNYIISNPSEMFKDAKWDLIRDKLLIAK